MSRSGGLIAAAGRKMLRKTCEWCCSGFLTKRKAKKFCGSRCRWAAWDARHPRTIREAKKITETR